MSVNSKRTIQLFSLRIGLLIASILATLLPTTAAAYDAPGRGSPVRKAVLDAVRPYAEDAYGAPIEFVVREIRVGRVTAFLQLEGQRPGGRPINVAKSPLHLRDGQPLDLINEPSTEALLRFTGGAWRVMHHAHAPTDVWWADSEYCPLFADVLPEICRTPARP